MATTRIIPLHAGKGRTVGKAISDIIDYVKNPDKTDHGRLITSYQCDSRVADAQFLLDKQTYDPQASRPAGRPAQGQSAGGHPGKIAGRERCRVCPLGQGVQPQTDGADPQLPVRTRAAGLC